MKAALFAFTRQGTKLSLSIKRELERQQYIVTNYTMIDFLDESAELQPIKPNLSALIEPAFRDCSLLVFVGASGIAVRSIAPFIKDKRHDPAVLCIDEKGQFVIPLLSGHIGGANKTALSIAKLLNAQAIITTATDINGLLAIDEWAERNDIAIADMKVAKQISAALLAGSCIALTSDFEITGDIPDHFELSAESNTMSNIELNLEPNLESNTSNTGISPQNTDCKSDDHQTGVCISLDETKKPYETTLNLIPRIAYVGIGCRKGIGVEQIENSVIDTLNRYNISIKALAGIASIDLKKEESGLLNLAAKYSLPITFYSAEELRDVQGDFTRSDFVQQVAGTDNVCERAAVLLSGGRLISAKTANNGVTTALALKSWRVHFGN